MCNFLLNYTFLILNLCAAPILSGGGAIKDCRHRSIESAIAIDPKLSWARSVRARSGARYILARGCGLGRSLEYSKPIGAWWGSRESSAWHWVCRPC
ncbi:hypothetical protein QUB63_24325 [Microcoleus sp. ARI1-B5]|uniref:hypothetical protein n=1 Tax=unclassified Microcoleus TaxID=2642155 RepID=UPI002FD6A0F7